MLPRFSEDLRLIDMDLATASFGMVTSTILCLPLARGRDPNSATAMVFLFAQVIIVAVMFFLQRPKSTLPMNDTPSSPTDMQ